MQRETRLRSVDIETPKIETSINSRQNVSLDWRRGLSWRWVTFIAFVVVPTLAAGAYLYLLASDQYVSEFRFRLRHAEPSHMSAASALAGLTGASAAVDSMSDSEIVVQYIESRQILDDLAPKLNIDQLYNRPTIDWYSRLKADASIEDKLKYWRSVVDPFYDSSTGIVTVKVRAFLPNEAEHISQSVLNLAEKLVNNLSDRAQADKLSYATKEIADKAEALREAELAMRQFRNTNAILFPTIQATEASGLDSKLRETVSKDRVAIESLKRQGVSANAPQMQGLQSEVTSLEAELERLQTGVTRNSTESGSAASPPLATLLAAYDRLDIDDKLATKAYETALSAGQLARDEANQQHIYLDAFVTPALPEKSLYPVRWRALLQVAFASFAIWSLGLLLWRAVIDHID
jgi:capsular polysaccharide transport system permease protein